MLPPYRTFHFCSPTERGLKHHGLPMYESSHAMKHFSMEGSFHFNFMNYGLRMDVLKNGSFQLSLLKAMLDVQWMELGIAHGW